MEEPQPATNGVDPITAHTNDSAIKRVHSRRNAFSFSMDARASVLTLRDEGQNEAKLREP